MATVYLAEDLKHDRKVAVKVLRPDSSRCTVIVVESFLERLKAKVGNWAVGYEP